MSHNALDRFSDSDWNSLVGEIYESALHPEQWGDTLLSIGQPLNAHAAQLVVVANDVSDSFDDIIVGLDTPAIYVEFEDLISRGLHVRATSGARIPELTTITDHDHTSASEMKRHAFYQEHAIPHDIPFYGATVVSKSKDTFIANVVLRSGKFGHLTQREVSYMNRLGPHIRRSLELSFRLPREGIVNGVMSALERMSCGSIIVDRQGFIVAVNDKASKILGVADGISDLGGNLSLMDRQANRALCQELQLSLGYRLSSSAAGPGCVRAKRPSGLSPYSLFVAPVEDRDTAMFRQQLAIVLLIDPEEEFSIPAGFLRESFDLTPAESEVAMLLVSGQSLVEIARSRNSRIATVRSQLKKVFEKTNCSHQTELVSKLARCLTVRLTVS